MGHVRSFPNGAPGPVTPTAPSGPAAEPGRFRLWVVHPARTLVFWVGFLSLIALGVLLEVILVGLPGLVIPAGRQRYRRRVWNGIIDFWCRNVSRLTRIAMGMTVDIEGRVPRGRFIVASNHQSTVDIVQLFEVFPGARLKFLAKKQLHRGVPFVSWALRYGGHGEVDFDNPLRSLRDLVGFARGLEAWDGCPVVFPEGRRTIDGTLGPMQGSGLRLLARETGLPVVPVVIDGLWRARSLGSFLRYLPGAHARVSILAAIPAEEADADDIASRLAGLMRDELERMRGSAHRCTEVR